MIREFLTGSAVLTALTLAVACGGGQPSTPPPAAAPPAAAPSAAPAEAKPAATISLLEPTEGAMGGHIDMFRW